MHTAPFQQPQAFLAVARRRSFSGAARARGVSRSALPHVPVRGRRRAGIPQAPRSARATARSSAPRVHHVPIADDQRALRLGARAGSQELSRAGSRRRRHQRRPARRVARGAEPWASLRARAGGYGATARWTPEDGAGGLRAGGARLLPLLPEPVTAFRAAAPLRRGGQRILRSQIEERLTQSGSLSSLA